MNEVQNLVPLAMLPSGFYFSRDGRILTVAVQASVILKNFDLEQLRAIACYRLKDYLNRNPQGEQSLYRDYEAMKVLNSMRSHYTDEQPSDTAG
ncbi:MAG TPA: hypothetical protein V6C91_06535 [Coleofasciculaceae cyanobacterium]